MGACLAGEPLAYFLGWHLADSLKRPDRLALERIEAIEAENKRLEPYVGAFQREEDRADKLGRQNDELKAQIGILK